MGKILVLQILKIGIDSVIRQFCVFASYDIALYRYETVIRKHNTTIDSRYKTYDEIKAECLRKDVLFEDPEFPANDESLFFSQRTSMNFKWKRPHVSCF